MELYSAITTFEEITGHEHLCTDCVEIRRKAGELQSATLFDGSETLMRCDSCQLEFHFDAEFDYDDRDDIYRQMML